MSLTIGNRTINRVLVVDDNQDVRKDYGYSIEDLGLEPVYETGPLQSLDESLKQMSKKADALVCDYHLRIKNFSQFNGDQLVASFNRERDEIAFNILRLDPLQRHAQADFQRVSNLSGLWTAVANAASHQPTPSSDLFPLDASRSALEKQGAESASAQRMIQFDVVEQMQSRRENLSPALAVAQTPFVRVAGQMVMNNSSEGE
jgi:CheY-like chemotaxis protein